MSGECICGAVSVNDGSLERSVLQVYLKLIVPLLKRYKSVTVPVITRYTSVTVTKFITILVYCVIITDLVSWTFLFE